MRSWTLHLRLGGLLLTQCQFHENRFQGLALTVWFLTIIDMRKRAGYPINSPGTRTHAIGGNSRTYRDKVLNHAM